MRKVYTLLAVFACAAILAAWGLGVFFSPPPPRPLPNPNGYDDFVKAGQLVLSYDSSVKATNQIYNFDKVTKAELAVIISSNEAALKLIRAGLALECREPVEYSTNYASNLMDRLPSFKVLARLLEAEGRLAELEGRTNDAARIYLDGVHFGQECARGGLLISRLVDIACEAIALNRLQALAGKLDAAGAREVAQTMEPIDAKEAPIEEVFAQEKLWSRKTGGIQGQIAMLISYKQEQKIHDSVMAKEQRIERQRRATMITAAARAYELEKGKQAQGWTDLVPAYLKAVPKDPVTGRDWILGP